VQKNNHVATFDTEADINMGRATGSQNAQK